MCELRAEEIFKIIMNSKPDNISMTPDLLVWLEFASVMVAEDETKNP